MYDPTREYIPRSSRPEWSAVGLLGKLVCIDDGTAQVNSYVKVNDNSIATASTERTKYRVMERLDESHIKIMIL
ncbi:peptidase G2 autoproteolytic cleavage domain-containing protein [Butyrivibrio sp. AE3004]|uniref:peptidase G2 autoproteolytic cleavage domain-containing protein n=1 Tax=Butyrivibrio sp. AE3004 TaxID=1506994 RepID=UPI000ABC71EB|nr:peptidase G2 autoproteolytic cleavage domain-containing protein [Butyrivibrio sp. AE3004]